MIAALGSKILAGLGGRAGVIAVSMCLGVLVVLAFTARFMLHTIEDQAAKIAKLQTELETEQHQRLSDVNGLTTLIDGLLIDSAKNDQDQGAIEHALEQAEPRPLSPFMRAYFDCLRNHRAGSESCATVAADSGAGSGADGAEPPDGL